MKTIALKGKWLRAAAMTAALAMMVTASARAELPGAHPDYLRSRSDLRLAEALLRYTDDPGVMHKLERAADNIHRAVGDLDRAIFLDRKPEAANPPVDVPRYDRAGRLREIERLLNGSLTDLALPEDNREAREPRRAASEHIRTALVEVQEARRLYADARVVIPPPVQPPPPPPPAPVVQHPHYLHSLADLRWARALLDRHGEREWRHERERVEAIAEIDRAIAEVKRASINDGKELADHPVIDWGVPRHDRLVRAANVLDTALSNLNFEEDNFAALGWRDAARRHVREAHRLVELAMGD